MLGVLSVWRLAHLFYAEDGPWDLLVWFRSRAGYGVFGSLLDCFFCLSLWIAVPFVFLIGGNWRQRILLWPALSAGAILINRIASPEQRASTVQYFEDEEEQHVVLRPEEKKIPRTDAGTGL